MSDSLSSVVSFEYLEQEIVHTVTSDDGRRHHWLWLTKRPARMAKFSQWLAQRSVPWPANLWAGTSITSQSKTSRVRSLLRVGDDSTTRFLSVEPQCEQIDLTPWLPRLDWVIQGGESVHGAVPFDVEWADDLLRQCRTHEVPYFLKQLGTKVVRKGKRLSFDDNHAGDWSEWPKDLRVRQMPMKHSAPLKPPEAVPAVKRRGSPKTAEELSAIAHKAVATRKANERKRRRMEAALKAWETRRSRAGE